MAEGLLPVLLSQIGGRPASGSGTGGLFQYLGQAAAELVAPMLMGGEDSSDDDDDDEQANPASAGRALGFGSRYLESGYLRSGYPGGGYPGGRYHGGYPRGGRPGGPPGT